jgi:hypothetical protein
MRLRKIIILATLYFSIGTNASAAWVKFGENDRLISYYEPAKSSIGENITIWVMYDYKIEQKSLRSGRQYFSQKGQQEVDCIGHRSRTLFFTWHAARMGEGAVIYTGSKIQQWEPDSPESLARALSSTVCSQK